MAIFALCLVAFCVLFKRIKANYVYNNQIDQQTHEATRETSGVANVYANCFSNSAFAYDRNSDLPVYETCDAYGRNAVAFVKEQIEGLPSYENAVKAKF